MHVVADKYVVLNEISRCRYGSVHLATQTRDRGVVAIKFVPTNVVKCFDKHVVQRLCKLRTSHVDQTAAKLPAEFVYGTMCASPEVIQYEGCYLDQGCWAMVMQFPEGFSILRDHIIGHGPLEPSALRQVARQLAAAMNTCVVNGVDHRGLSAENVLYNPETRSIKLVGFGHADTLSSGKEPYKAPKDLSNHPPEAKRHGVCSPLQTLVYKYGCILQFCAVGAGRLSRLAHSSSSPKAHTDPLSFLMKRAMDEDPRTRILFSNLQKHVRQHL